MTTSKQKIPVWNWRDAIRKSDMSLGAKCLCHSIACYLNDAGGYAYPPVEDLMRDTSSSNSSVARYIKEAIAAGFLRLQRMHNEKGYVYGTRYHPTFPENVVLAVEAEPTRRLSSGKKKRILALNDKYSSGQKTLDDKFECRPVLRENLTRLDDNLEGLDDKLSRHKSPYNSQNNKIPPTPLAGGNRASSSPVKRQPTPPAYTPAFERAFTMYPGSGNSLAGSKSRAWEAWQAQGCEVIADEVIAGVRRYADAMREEGKKGRTIRRMDGWLRERRWEAGEPERTPQRPQMRAQPAVTLDGASARAARMRELVDALRQPLQTRAPDSTLPASAGAGPTPVSALMSGLMGETNGGRN